MLAPIPTVPPDSVMWTPGVTCITPTGPGGMVVLATAGREVVNAVRTTVANRYMGSPGE